jgi:hypothetical protein
LLPTLVWNDLGAFLFFPQRELISLAHISKLPDCFNKKEKVSDAIRKQEKWRLTQLNLINVKYIITELSVKGRRISPPVLSYTAIVVVIIIYSDNKTPSLSKDNSKKSLELLMRL